MKKNREGRAKSFRDAENGFLRPTKKQGKRRTNPPFTATKPLFEARIRKKRISLVPGSRSAKDLSGIHSITFGERSRGGKRAAIPRTAAAKLRGALARSVRDDTGCCGCTAGRTRQEGGISRKAGPVEIRSPGRSRGPENTKAYRTRHGRQRTAFRVCLRSEKNGGRIAAGGERPGYRNRLRIFRKARFRSPKRTRRTLPASVAADSPRRSRTRQQAHADAAESYVRSGSSAPNIWAMRSATRCMSHLGVDVAPQIPTERQPSNHSGRSSFSSSML